MSISKQENSNTTKTIALIGMPNVGKSSLFNAITGLHQHTGNWTGKTVECAYGEVTYKTTNYKFVDLPGCYSLNSRSPEEKVSKDYLLSNEAEISVVVCDALALQRNLNLFYQVKEIKQDVILCINMIDEATKMNVEIDTQVLSDFLHSPVITTTAHNKNCKNIILDAIDNYSFISDSEYVPIIKYPDYIEEKIERISKSFNNTPHKNRINAIKVIEENSNIDSKNIVDDIIYTISKKSFEAVNKSVKKHDTKKPSKQHKIDKLLTHKLFGFLCMFVLLLVVFWITLVGANYPTTILNNFFLSLEPYIYNIMKEISIPRFFCEMMVYGMYHILTKIISVMLPPMAIFFPLFTLLEDIGYLPRIAFNLDRCFKKCSACGKQALTMCMGFGCNSAGVVGCRIIDSPREQLIAIITNNFIPCNGRFPAIISIITMFFISSELGIFSSFLSAVILTLFIFIGILMSMLVSLFLSKTLLKGVKSSYILELPHYRKPQFLKIIVRSLFERTLFVLARAIKIAAPAGIVIWLFANIEILDTSILTYISNLLDPLGKLMGLDGIILTAFLFGLPANEIVVPLIFMMYVSEGVITDISDLTNLKSILIANGWTYVTAINTILFMIMHWPCSTTCLTIKAETKSLKWTILSIIIPTLCGIITCIITNLIL